jgi:hypothetical protein
MGGLSRPPSGQTRRSLLWQQPPAQRVIRPSSQLIAVFLKLTTRERGKACGSRSIIALDSRQCTMVDSNQQSLCFTVGSEANPVAHQGWEGAPLHAMSRIHNRWCCGGADYFWLCQTIRKRGHRVRLAAELRATQLHATCRRSPAGVQNSYRTIWCIRQ